MSYNIDHIEHQMLNVRTNAPDIIRLYDEFEAELPEVCFLADHYDDALEAMNTKRSCKCGCANDQDASFCKKCGKKVTKKATGTEMRLGSLQWSGEGSGATFGDVFVKIVAPLISGVAELIMYWEGGDSIGALLIKDGKVAEAEVKQVIVRPKDW